MVTISVIAITIIVAAGEWGPRRREKEVVISEGCRDDLC